MPPWARSSRQWALLVGRAGMSRTRRRQADLMAEWDVRFNRYRSFLEGTVSQEGDGLEETRAYFHSVVKNACDMLTVMNETERRGCAVQGGMQLVRWPDERTGGALEAVEAMERWDGKSPALRIPGRWCTAAVGVGGDVYVIDGWRNLSSSGDVAADARLVMADIFGSGSNQVVFLGSDNLLRAWSPADGARLLARGEFLTGPLGSGDVDGNGREEIVVLAGPSPDKASLTVVNGDGDVQAMAIRPGGSQPDEPVRGAYREETWIPRAVRMDCEPRLVICDVDGDGQQEIICSDRDDGDRLVVLNGHGNRKMMGPVMQAGALAAADLNGDGNPEVVFLNGNGLLQAFSAKSGVLAFEESVKPRWPSVATPQWEKEELPGVVFVDAEGYLRIVSLRGASRRVSDLPSSVAMAPGLTVGDFDGDGREEICYLRRHLSFVYPLVRLSCMNESGGMHDLSKSPWGSPEEAPFGPRASGRMRLGSEV